MIPARWRTWLFDLDGTLVDSGPAHERAYVDALAELWPDGLTRFRYAEHLGRPTVDVMSGLGAPDPARLAARKQALYQRRAVLDVRAAPGADHLLALLRHRGREVHVVTGASRRSAELSLRATGLDRWVGALLTADDVPAGKPDPAPYAEACRRFADGDPDRAVAVEDSSHGVAAAVAAGLATIRVGTAGPPAGAVPSSGAVVDVRDLDELAGTLW